MKYIIILAFGYHNLIVNCKNIDKNERFLFCSINTEVKVKYSFMRLGNHGLNSYMYTNKSLLIDLLTYLPINSINILL